MRYRVDFANESGYISLDESEKEKAFEIYRERGCVRIRECRDIHDEGVVIVGLPIYEDRTRDRSNEN